MLHLASRFVRLTQMDVVCWLVTLFWRRSSIVVSALVFNLKVGDSRQSLPSCRFLSQQTLPQFVYLGSTLEQRRVDARLALLSRSTAESYQLTPESTSDIQLEDPGTHTATASFLYLLVPPLTVFYSTLEQSLSGTVCLSLFLRTLI